jgi:ABC-type uncharacterized transport system substrate-binding protein
MRDFSALVHKTPHDKFIRLRWDFGETPSPRTPVRKIVRASNLMSFRPNLEEMFRELGIGVGELLQGAEPTAIPEERPTRFELVVNLSTANALHLAISASAPVRADRAIA